MKVIVVVDLVQKITWYFQSWAQQGDAMQVHTCMPKWNPKEVTDRPSARGNIRHSINHVDPHNPHWIWP